MNLTVKRAINVSRTHNLFFNLLFQMWSVLVDYCLSLFYSRVFLSHLSKKTCRMPPRPFWSFGPNGSSLFLLSRFCENHPGSRVRASNLYLRIREAVDREIKSVDREIKIFCKTNTFDRGKALFSCSNISNIFRFIIFLLTLENFYVICYYTYHIFFSFCF